MDVELRFVPEAHQDLLDAYSWYENQRIGLGEEFLSRVDACIQSILRFPDLNPIVFQNYRRALVRQFPYAVFYERTLGIVTIYSIFHLSRDPEKWRQRLSDN